MLKYIFIRLLFMVLTLFLVATLLYFALNLIMMIKFARPPKPAFLDAFYQIAQGYGDYMKGIVTEWDFGKTRTNDSVWEELLHRAPITLGINLATFVVYIILGLSLGLIAAIKHNTMIDSIIGFFTMLFGSIPPFVLMLPLVIYLGYQTDIFPARYPLADAAFSSQARAYVIPIIALSGPAIAQLSRFLRGELVEISYSDHMILARAKGLTKRQAFNRHALRNAFVPIIPEIPSIFILVLMNSFFIERVYQINGMANWFLRSMYQPFMESGYILIYVPNAILISLFYTAIALFGLIITDVLLVFIDPRIKMGMKKS